MGRLDVRGPDALKLVQWLTTNDAGPARRGPAQYSLICGERGQILDDIIVYNLGDQFLLVVNASNRLKIRPGSTSSGRGRWPASTPPSTIDLRDGDDRLPGPESERLLQGLVSGDLATLRYYASVKSTVYPQDAWSRAGYTGEDGFELIVSAEDGEVWDLLLEERHGVQPIAAALGADTLRLEAGAAAATRSTRAPTRSRPGSAASSSWRRASSPAARPSPRSPRASTISWPPSS